MPQTDYLPFPKLLQSNFFCGFSCNCLCSFYGEIESYFGVSSLEKKPDRKRSSRVNEMFCEVNVWREEIVYCDVLGVSATCQLNTNADIPRRSRTEESHKKPSRNEDPQNTKPPKNTQS